MPEVSDNNTHFLHDGNLEHFHWHKMPLAASSENNFLGISTMHC